MSFFEELKRRNVFRAGIAYVVVAWLMLQVADVILGNIQAPDWIFKVILLVLAIGFPLVLVLAWAFELTAEGLKRDADLGHPESVPVVTGRQLDFAIIGVLVIALGYFVYDKFAFSPVQTDRSIAVLPFDNKSSDAEQDYFSDGLSEELLNLLAKIPILRVIARTSSFAYKDEADIAEISRELNVSHLLDGSVQKDGAKVRIRAQLIRVNDESVLWSESYDRTLDDIFKIQDEIAAAVVSQLKINLLGALPSATEIDPEAYRLYLQARQLSRQSTKEGLLRSNSLYEQSLKIAPAYAAAEAGLAENYIVLASRAMIEPIGEAYGLASEAAERALKDNPGYAPAHASLGRIAMVHGNDLAKAARYLERALQLDPTNIQIIRASATLLASLNRLDEAIELLEYGVARDPVSSAVHANLGLYYYCAGRPDDAIAAYRTALDLSPDGLGWKSFVGEALLLTNDPAAALPVILEEPSEPWRLIGLVMAHHVLGNKGESDARLDELIKKYGDEWPYNIAYVLAFRGETQRAFDWLGKAKNYNDPGLSEIVTAPEFDSIRSDPRWLDFLDSIKKSPRQLDAIKFTVTRPK